MGMLGRLRGCGCRQRPPAAQASVCPISGQTSSTGVCPISGQSLPSGRVSDKPKEPTKAKASKVEAWLQDPLLGAKSQADAETAVELKEQGNDKFKKQQFEDALHLYTEAVQLQPRDSTLWLNRSIANRQLKNWEDAEQDAEIAVELQPSNSKAYYSRALCQQQLGRLPEALASCRAGLKAQPDNKALLQLQGAVKRGLGAQQPGAGVRGRKEPVTQLGQQGGVSEEVGARVGYQDEHGGENTCPASQLKENDLQDIKEKAKSAAFKWQGSNPSQEERQMLKQMMVDMFRGKYEELAKGRKEATARGTSLQTNQYDKLQKQGLQLKGGHQPMERPEHVDLPESYQEPLGIISLEELKTYSFANPERRYLISVWGNCFDVSDRPDKYGPEGPYTILTGADITWGLFAGVDTEDYVNRCYDLFKARDMGKDKLAGVCSWLAWYWTEYGDPVAQLDLYQRESELPEPPLEEVAEICAVM